MREVVNGIEFFSDFDSGNLAKVESTDETKYLSVNEMPSEYYGDNMGPSRQGRSRCNSATDIFRSRKRVNTPLSYKPTLQRRSKSCSNLESIRYLINLENKNREKQTPKKVQEFRAYTKNDCSGTPFENANRTWFFFGVRPKSNNVRIRFNLMNLNKQGKLMSQGMSPVYKNVPGESTWKRIPEKPTYLETENDFVLTFEHQLGNVNTVTYFAFTYPFSYENCQEFIQSLVDKLGNQLSEINHKNNIYFSRELLCLTPNGQRVDLLTISSIKGIQTQNREERLPHLFPDLNTPLSRKFGENKKVVFLSSRVHPGETQSSFVLNGFIKFIISSDPRAICLRDIYVFKIVPILNPDGVLHGHYRTDLEGVNLNRKYLNCDPQAQPSVFATRSLLLYYHFEYNDSGVNLDETSVEILKKFNEQLEKDLEGGDIDASTSDFDCGPSLTSVCGIKNAWNKRLGHKKRRAKLKPWQDPKYFISPSNSGLAFFIDLHGHASKRGCFIFGNNFSNIIDKMDCMLLAKLMSLNFQHFDLSACNFSLENMTHIGSRDKLSKEGSARVSVYYLTKIIRSYTFECNFNTGRIVNQLPPLKSGNVTVKPVNRNAIPPMYTPKIFEEAGEALAVSILDITGKNPLSRLTLSPYRDLEGVKDWLMQYLSGGKTVSAWRHPRTRYFNALKKSSTISQSVNEKAVMEKAKNSHKKCVIHEPVKVKHVKVKIQRNVNIIKDTVPKIHISHHDESEKIFWPLPLNKQTQRKGKNTLTRSARWKGSNDSLKRCVHNQDYGGSGSDLCVLGTVCRPNSASRSIQSKSVNI